MSVTLFRSVSFYNRRIIFAPCRNFVKAGDKVPINFLAGAKPPEIKKPEEYPDWIKTLHAKLPSKTQLLKRIEIAGLKSLSQSELKRAKRLLTLETIKTNNATASASK